MTFTEWHALAPAEKRLDEARSDLEKALAKDPTNEALQEALKRSHNYGSPVHPEGTLEWQRARVGRLHKMARAVRATLKAAQ